MHVLLAEDSLFNQRLAIGVLEQEGHTVVVANNGLEAIEAVQSGRFNVVLMDVQMSEMDGLEATAAIRKWEAEVGGHIPIIAMTAHAMKGDRELCLEAGMDGYIPKPVRANELFAALRGVLAKTGNVAGSPAAPPPPRAAFDIDLSDLLDNVGGKQSLLLELVNIFLDECPRNIAQMRQAIDNRDPGTLRLAAHTLKGSLRLFGAEHPASLAHALEELGKRETLDQANSELAKLERDVQHLLASLRAYTRNSTAQG